MTEKRLVHLTHHQVALLAEGVDRNRLSTSVSLPRAKVALLAEGVDRNYLRKAIMATVGRRPPRGGRG